MMMDYKKLIDDLNQINIGGEPVDAGSPTSNALVLFDGASWGFEDFDVEVSANTDVISAKTHADDSSIHLSSIQKLDLTDAGESTLHYHDSDRARVNHTGTQIASTISDFDTEVSNNPDVSAAKAHSDDSSIHLSSVQKTDLTDTGESTLHYHASDRARANHTGTQTASTVSDFDTEVGNHTDVAANTAARHGHDKFFGYLQSSTLTGGTNWTAIGWYSNVKSGYTHTDSSEEITIDNSGYHVVHVELTTDFNAATTTQHIKLQEDSGAGYSDISMSYRRAAVPRTPHSQIVMHLGPYYFSAGDKIKALAKFDASDPGSLWLQNECVISVWSIK